MQTIRQLVSGTDFSVHADHAVELAVALAVAARAGVTLVHVCELEADDRCMQACGEALSAIVARHSRCGIEVAGCLRRGQPWKKLDNVAAEVGAGLIVVGRHGAGRGPDIEIGSVAQQLVRTAHRSVLTAACDVDCFGGEADITPRFEGGTRQHGTRQDTRITRCAPVWPNAGHGRASAAAGARASDAEQVRLEHQLHARDHASGR